MTCNNVVTVQLPGSPGLNAFTVTTASFVQPAINATVSVPVGLAIWAAIGQVIYIAGGGYYQVISLPDNQHLLVENLGYLGNASPTTVIASGEQVSPAGVESIGAAIQIQNQGINTGTPGQATTYNFTGAGVSTTVSGSTATINIAGAGPSAFPVAVLDSVVGGTLSNGNLRLTSQFSVSNAVAIPRRLAGIPSMFEVARNGIPLSSADNPFLGWVQENATLPVGATPGVYINSNSASTTWNLVYWNGSISTSYSFTASLPAQSDVYGLTHDPVTGAIGFYINGNPITLPILTIPNNVPVKPYISINGGANSTDYLTVNFGSTAFAHPVAGFGPCYNDENSAAQDYTILRADVAQNDFISIDAGVDMLVLATASAVDNMTVQLPASPENGQRCILKKEDATIGTAILDGNGKLIDGASTQVLTTQYKTVSVEYSADAGAWVLLVVSSSGGGGPPIITTNMTYAIPTDYATMMGAITALGGTIALDGAIVTLVDHRHPSTVNEQVIIKNLFMPWLNITTSNSGNDQVNIDSTGYANGPAGVPSQFIVINSRIGNITGTWNKSGLGPVCSLIQNYNSVTQFGDGTTTSSATGFYFTGAALMGTHVTNKSTEIDTIVGYVLESNANVTLISANISSQTCVENISGNLSANSCTFAYTNTGLLLNAGYSTSSSNIFNPAAGAVATYSLSSSALVSNGDTVNGQIAGAIIHVASGAEASFGAFNASAGASATCDLVNNSNSYVQISGSNISGSSTGSVLVPSGPQTTCIDINYASQFTGGSTPTPFVPSTTGLYMHG